MHESERGIEIAYGTIFRVTADTKYPDLVTDVGEGDCFSTANIQETEEGERWFFLTGDRKTTDIHEIIGQMSYEEVMRAAELGARQWGFDSIPEEMRRMLQENSRKKPRII